MDLNGWALDWAGLGWSPERVTERGVQPIPRVAESSNALAVSELCLCMRCSPPRPAGFALDYVITLLLGPQMPSR